MTFDINLVRQLVGLAIDGAKAAGANSPTFDKITGTLAPILGRVPELAAEKAQLDAVTRDAIDKRRAAFDRSREAGRYKPPSGD
ncbi:MAG: hypothetical protein QOH47_2425 [Sphingomonadales bacterium]|jgi:hypothetical protein|nr:hypothetical protein [Sphingomonadales bacterium]